VALLESVSLGIVLDYLECPTVLGSACVLVCMLLLCMLFAFKQTTQHDSVGYVC
jgi:hypothetical protein